MVGVIAAIAASVLVTRLAFGVDDASFEVLEQTAADLVPQDEFELLSTERSPAEPCWWWCEDYQLTVDVRSTYRPLDTVDPAAQCERMRRTLTEFAGAAPAEYEGTIYTECSLFAIDVPVGDQVVSVGVDVDQRASVPISLHVTNESAERAFLPYG